MDTLGSFSKRLESSTDLRSPACHPTLTTAGSRDPAVSPYGNVAGLRGRAKASESGRSLTAIKCRRITNEI